MTKKPKSGRAGQFNANSRDRVSRLFLWLDESLEQLERRQSGGEAERSAADNEKDARTMISLMRFLEKLVEMKERLDEKAQGAKPDNRGYSVAEVEQKRLEIAARIERLQKSSGTKKDARRS